MLNVVISYRITTNTKVITSVDLYMYVLHTQRDIPADSMFLSSSFDIRCFACCPVWLYDSPITSGRDKVHPTKQRYA